MKINRFMIAVMAASVIFASCSKEGGNSNSEAGQKAKLTIKISNPTNSVNPGRSTGAAPASDNTVDNFVAFAFRADGSLDVPIIKFTGQTTTVDVTTAARYLYIVANAGVTPSFITGITSKTALEAVIEDLDAQQTSRWASVSGEITFTQSGTNFSATFDKALTFVSARIVLTIVNEMPGYDGTTENSVILTDVAVLNAMGKSKLFGTSLVPAAAGKAYYAGIDYTGFANKPESAVTKTYLKDTYSNTNKYYYYIFENDATTATALPTIVTLVGTYNGGAIYFPVHIAPYESFFSGTASSIQRGKSYVMTITLKGDPAPNSGGGGGTTDPTEPVVTATIDVDISITDWDPIAIEKQFE